MKTTLKILLFVVALAGITACSPQKRAARHLRRAVELCPELVQTKAHHIDTVLTAPAFADAATFAWKDLASFDTIYAATDHGTVVVSLRQSDSALRVGFVAAPQKIRFQDTLHYAQLVVDHKQPEKKNDKAGWIEFLTGLACFMAGIAVALYLLLKKQP